MTLFLIKDPINLLNAELNPICHLLELLGAHPILHVSRIRVKYKHIYRSVYPSLDAICITMEHACFLE